MPDIEPQMVEEEEIQSCIPVSQIEFLPMFLFDAVNGPGLIGSNAQEENFHHGIMVYQDESDSEDVDFASNEYQATQVPAGTGYGANTDASGDASSSGTNDKAKVDAPATEKSDEFLLNWMYNFMDSSGATVETLSYITSCLGYCGTYDRILRLLRSYPCSFKEVYTGIEGIEKRWLICGPKPEICNNV